MKVPFIVYADIEILFEKIDTNHRNPEKSPTAYKKYIKNK